MRKSAWILVLLLVLGIVAAAIVTRLIAPVHGLAFLAKTAEFHWEPSADLQVIKYNIAVQIKLNLLSVIGIAAAIWIYRKL